MSGGRGLRVPGRVRGRGAYARVENFGKARTRGAGRAYAGRVPGVLGRVLVVDDSQAIRQLIRVNLELDGFEVVTAADGAECLERVHCFRPDVITLDVSMPRLDGPGVVERLRRDPGTWHIPVVLVSASSSRLRVAAVDAVLVKPFEPAELVREVRRLSEKGRLPQVVQLVKPVAAHRRSSRTLTP